jgi:putative peptidoglycan lipid II flippase
VLAGIAQSHHRFLGPALAPLLSSLVVITAYLIYAGQGATSLARLSRAQELTLSVGTTLGVAVLSLGLLVPVRRCGLRLRPTWQFPPGVARRIRALAFAGVAGLVAQQLALVVALRLAAHGSEGTVVVFQVATAVFLLPWAVLAVPVATTAFPRLSASAQEGAAEAYADVASRSVAAVVVAMAGAAAVLIAVAEPAARLLVAGVPGPENVAELANGVVAFAPGLVGYGVLAMIGRALYARGDNRTVAVATVAGWVVVAVLDVVLVAATDLDRVMALGLGNTAGMTVAGTLLTAGLWRAVPGALRGCAPMAAAAALAAVVATAVAAAVPNRGGSVADSVLSGVVLTAVSGSVFLVVLRVVRPTALRVLLDAGVR